MGPFQNLARGYSSRAFLLCQKRRQKGRDTVPNSKEFGTLSRSPSGILLLRIDSSDATRHLPKVQVMSGSLTLIPTSSCRRLWRFTCMAGISPTEQLRLHLLVPRSTHLKGHPGRRQGRWWSGGGKGGAGNTVFMRLVEIGANRQSCEPSTILLFKLVLDTVLDGCQCPSHTPRLDRRSRPASSEEQPRKLQLAPASKRGVHSRGGQP